MRFTRSASAALGQASRFGRNNPALVLIGPLILASALFVPYFATELNVRSMLSQAAVVGIVACGMTILMIAFGVDLAAGSIVAIAGIAYGLAQALGVPLAMTIAVGAGALSGLLNGLIVTRLRVNFFIATLATMVAIQGLTLFISGGKPIQLTEPGLDWIGLAEIGPVDLPFVVLAIVALVSHLLLQNTRQGRYWYAIGASRDAAVRAGLRADRHYALAFVVAGLCSGLAGVVLAARLSTALPVPTLQIPLLAISATVIGGTSLYGGRGSIPGMLTGLILLVVARNVVLLTGVPQYIDYVIQGGILVGVVVFSSRVSRRGGEASQGVFG